MADPILDLARQIHELKSNVRALGSSAQLQHSSFEDGAIQGYAGDQKVMQIGLQWDGTYTSAVTNGPTPPTPSTPTALEGTESATLIWDGTFANGAVAPMDFLRVDVHVSAVNGFTPDHTNRYGTIVAPAGGSIPVNLPYGTYYAKLVCWSQAGVVSVASGQLEFDVWPIEVSSDGFAPSASPNPEVFQGIREMYVRWTGVTNADPVWYDVHISPTLGFTPDSTTLVGSTQATAYTIDALPGAAPPESEEDPRLLAYDTPYYVRIVARDEDGSAAPSLQAVGGVFQVTGINLAVDSVAAQHIAVGSLTGELFSASVIYAGTFKTAESGQRIETGIAGIQGYKSDGALMINFPTDPAQTALIDAEIIARGLTVTGGASFRSTSYVERDSVFTLKSAVGAPVATPQLATTWQTRLPETGSLTDAQVTGPLGTFRLIPSEVTCIEWKDDVDNWVIHQIRPGGTRAWFFDYDGNPVSWSGVYFADYVNWEIWSVINITTSTPAKNGVYRISRWIPTDTYYLQCPQGGGFNRYSRLNSLAPPVVGTNGTDVYVAEVVGTQLNIRYFLPNGDGNNLSAPTTVYQSAQGFTASRPLSTVFYDAGAFDTGAGVSRYLVGERGFNTNNKLVYTSGTNAGSIHPGGTTAGPSSWTASTVNAESFEAAHSSPRCITWMNGEDRFWTYGGDGYLYQHTNEFWDPSVTSSTVWVQESYYNHSTLYETVPGPFKSFTRPRRSNVIVYLPPLPGAGGGTEPTRWKIYAARKTTQPTNSEMWLQSTTDGVSDVITPLATSGTNPLTSGTFPNSNPGKVQSDDATLVLSGDGTLKIGGLDVSLGKPTREVFTSSGTWNKPARAALVRVWALGGGGAGGGAAATSVAGTNAKGGGGAAGAPCEKWFLASDLASSIAVGVGGGGVGVVNAGGGNGGNSTFQHTTQVVAAGGPGGAVGTASGAAFGSSGGNGATSTGGDINGSGASGLPSWGQGTLGMSGTGGSSPLGGGGSAITDSNGNKSITGVAGTGYGAGGSGGYTSMASVAQAARAGGNGSPGIVIVEVYYL